MEFLTNLCQDTPDYILTECDIVVIAILVFIMIKLFGSISSSDRPKR